MRCFSSDGVHWVFYTTLWGVSQRVSTYRMASRVTCFFAKVSRLLTAPPCASGGFGAGRLLPPPPRIQKSEKTGEGSAPVATGSRRHKRVTNGSAHGSNLRIDGTIDAPGIAWPDARPGPQQRPFGALCMPLHVAASSQSARGWIERPWAAGSRQRPRRSPGIERPCNLRPCARRTRAAACE